MSRSEFHDILKIYIQFLGVNVWIYCIILVTSIFKLIFPVIYHKRIIFKQTGNEHRMTYSWYWKVPMSRNGKAILNLDHLSITHTDSTSCCAYISNKIGNDTLHFPPSLLHFPCFPIHWHEFHFPSDVNSDKAECDW